MGGEGIEHNNIRVNPGSKVADFVGLTLESLLWPCCSFPYEAVCRFCDEVLAGNSFAVGKDGLATCGNVNKALALGPGGSIMAGGKGIDILYDNGKASEPWHEVSFWYATYRGDLFDQIMKRPATTPPYCRGGERVLYAYSSVMWRN